MLRGAVGALILGAAMQPALACRCVEPASTATAYRRADVVVRARVQSVEGEGEAPGGALAHLLVDQAWKTDVPAAVDVKTSTTCAFDFKPGQDYLLYLLRDRQAGQLTTRICMGNLPASQADSALQWMHKHGRGARSLPNR